MKFLQKLGKALMLPVAVLPILILTSGSTEDMAHPSSWNCSIYRILCCIPFCHQEI